MILKTEGLVLKTFDFRETSRIATFFTRDYGKLKGVLKGIRRDPKKFGSHIDRFSVNDIVYYPSRTSELHLVSQCDLKEYFFPVRQDYRRSLAANYILELVDVVMPPEQPNGKVYHLMQNCLNALGSIRDIDKLVHIFQVKILALSGFRPHIDSCVKCQKKIDGQARFSVRSGGLICPRCRAPVMNLTPISHGTIASILHIEQSPWPVCLRLGLAKTVKAELKYILNNFLVHHLEKRIRTADYL